MVHVWRILHGTAERAIVLQSGIADADGCIPFVHISNPGNPVSERARCRWVLERLVMKNLRKRRPREKRLTWTTRQNEKLSRSRVKKNCKIGFSFPSWLAMFCF